MDISVSDNNYNNYIGKYTGAMINQSDDDFTIIFQQKDEMINSLKDNQTEIESYDEVIIPLLLLDSEELISSAIPNIRILYNNNLNTESILSGYILGKIYRQEDVTELNNKITSNIDEILSDTNLIDELKPLIVQAEFADDFDFSQLEDQMFDIIDRKIKSL